MNGVSTILGWSLLHFLWQGAVIGVAGALALRLLRSSTSSIRYLVACGTLALMLAAPLGTVLTATALQAIFAPSASSPVAHGSNDRPAMGSAVVATPASLHTAATRRQGAEHSRLLTLLVALWAGGVAVMSLRLAGGWHRVHRMHRRALSAQPSPWNEASKRVASRLGLRRPVPVVESEEQTIPMLVGWMQPVIILPAACLAGLSPGQVEAILAHELAHVRRHDLLVSLLQSIAETLLFYHPAVWWISARIREEREYCCDDAAVQACGDPGEYVDALVRLEASRATSDVFVAAATDGSLVARARRLLAPREIPRGQLAAIAPVLLLFILTAGAIAHATGFDSPPVALASGPGWGPAAPIAITARATEAVPSVRAGGDAAPLVLPAREDEDVPGVTAEPGWSGQSGVVRPGTPADAGGDVSRGITSGVRGDVQGEVRGGVTSGAPEGVQVRGGLTSGAAGGVTGSVAGGVPGDVQGVRSTAAPADNARTVVLFDLASLAPEDLNASRLMALQFIDREMADSDLLAVISIAARVDVVADFTSDRDTLRAALQALESAVVPSPDSRTDAPALRRLAQLRTVCEILESVQGRKRLLLMTSGTQGGATEASELRQTTTACNRGNVAVYPIDARGLSVVPGSADVPGGQRFRGR
jgi:beta-lactamase regulating signal transducer with metallopeptidase domain